MYVAFCLSAKLTSFIGATNGFARLKSGFKFLVFDLEKDFRKKISNAFHCFMLGHAFGNTLGTT